MTHFWVPTKEEEDAALRVDASAAFRRPVVVNSTAAQMRSLITRLRAEPKESLVERSNRLYRAGLLADVAALEAATDQEPWERYCGDVLVFYAIRYVLDERGIPILPE